MRKVKDRKTLNLDKKSIEFLNSLTTICLLISFSVQGLGNSSIKKHQSPQILSEQFLYNRPSQRNLQYQCWLHPYYWALSTINTFQQYLCYYLDSEREMRAQLACFRGPSFLCLCKRNERSAQGKCSISQMGRNKSQDHLQYSLSAQVADFWAWKYRILRGYPEELQRNSKPSERVDKSRKHGVSYWTIFLLTR